MLSHYELVTGIFSSTYIVEMIRCVTVWHKGLIDSCLSADVQVLVRLCVLFFAIPWLNKLAISSFDGAIIATD